MSTSDTKYAIELSNEGVSLWLRGTDGRFNLLGQAALDDPNFSEKIGKIKKNHVRKDGSKLLAQVRIPQSEVFISELDLAPGADDAARSKINRFLEAKTPYDANDLVIDQITNPASGKTYLAAVTKQTLNEAKDFISSYGFKAAYYTTKLDKTDFPREPRFYDGDHPAIALPAQSKKQPRPISDVPPLAKSTLQKEQSPRETPLSAPEKARLSGFTTVRNKLLATPGKQPDSTGFIPAPPRPPSPAIHNRISIGLPKKKTHPPVSPTTPVTGSLKMPQGDANTISKTGFFNLRIIFLMVMVVVFAALYWFYITLFDGKEEISRLQQISDTAPVALSLPRELSYQKSPDTAPYVDSKASVAPPRNSTSKTGVTLAKPEPLETAEDKNNILAGRIATLEKPLAIPVQPAPTAPEATQEPASPTTAATAELTPTKEGTAGPEGITLYLGQPDIIPPHREQLKVSTDPLKNILPKMRPAGVAVIAEDLKNSLLIKADPDLADSKPKLRPTGLATAITQTVNPSEIDTAVQQANNGSVRPRTRPKSLTSTIANSDTSVQIAAISPDSARGTSVASPGASPINIQKEATEKTGLHKRRMLLIGVFGSAATRRAMLRMPSGRFVTVKPGQKISGWKVAAIGESSVRITKGSRNQVLRMPK